MIIKSKIVFRFSLSSSLFLNLFSLSIKLVPKYSLLIFKVILRDEEIKTSNSIILFLEFHAFEQCVCMSKERKHFYLCIQKFFLLLLETHRLN